MIIRQANFHDAPMIKWLLEQLGYNTRLTTLINQMETIYNRNDHQVLVYELRKEVVGFIAVSFIPQLGIDREIACINYLAVDESSKGHGVEKNLEEYVAKEARLRKCSKIEIQLINDYIVDYPFYEQQGYQISPKCFAKLLVHA